MEFIFVRETSTQTVRPWEEKGERAEELHSLTPVKPDVPKSGVDFTKKEGSGGAEAEEEEEEEGKVQMTLELNPYSHMSAVSEESCLTADHDASPRPAWSPSSPAEGPYSDKKKHCCPMCGKCFNYPSTLTRHIRIHTGEKPFECVVCGRCFSQKVALDTHVRKLHTPNRSDPKPHCCSVCAKCFAYPSDLTRHMCTHTGEKPFHCETCGKEFTQKSALDVHQRKHTGETPYRCGDCGRAFTRSEILKRHRLLVHSDKKPFSCEECNASFALKFYLDMHVQRHSGERPYQCSYCGKQFLKSGSLSRHKLIHSAVQENRGPVQGNCDPVEEHQCKDCGEVFRQRSGLMGHMRRHCVERPFPCNLCGKSFLLSQHLKVHLSTHINVTDPVDYSS